jgi:hypothetical protein
VLILAVGYSSVKNELFGIGIVFGKLVNAEKAKENMPSFDPSWIVESFG